MTLKTKAELATEMLKRSRIVGVAEDVPSEDMQRVTSIYDSKLEEWRDRSLVYWENTGLHVAEIPASCFDNLVALLINAAESQFGLNSNISQLDRMAIEDRLLRALRRHTRVQSARLPLEQDYF